MNMAEGRVLPKSALPFEGGDGYVYEYHHKDHLGNLRVAFRNATKEYVATMEETPTEVKELEEQEFEQIATTRDGTRAFRGTRSAKLVAEIGPYKMLKIGKDDRVSVSARMFYEDPVPSPTSTNYSTFFANHFGSGSEISNIFGNLGVGLTAFGTSPYASNVPHVYVKVIFYDEHDEPKQFAVERLQSGHGAWSGVMGTGELTASNDGYAKVFVVNESDEPVWVDDFTVTHQTLVVQENHYYPFGLNMAGLEKQGSPDHKFQFQGQEKQDEFGLNWIAFELRSLDTQLGRWCQIDPYNQYSSPYVGLGNSPVNGIDPDGGLFFGLFGSSAEQRQAARAAAKQLRGRVNNVWSKNISVTYWQTSKIGVGDDGVSNFLTTEHQIDFRENGKVDHGSVNVNKAIDDAEALNSPMASGRAYPFYFVQNPVEGLIQAGAAAADGNVEGAALAATAMLVSKVKVKGKVSLDNNALVGAIEYGLKQDVIRAIGGRSVTVSRQAVKEFLVKGDKQALRNFMKQTGATVSTNGASATQVTSLQRLAATMNAAKRTPLLKPKDARVAVDAINNGATIITRDDKLWKFMNAAGHNAEKF